MVDLFAGPGGLAEGFSRYTDANGSRPFEIALSVEKETAAFATLRFRSFFRQFGDEVPDDYYQHLSGNLAFDELIARHPVQWTAACNETLQLELGTPDAEAAIDPKLDAIRNEAGGNTILIGGPPCQAYSLVGRARNRGIADYIAGEDHRHFLYREYIRILGRLRPTAFVMENVKGMLSAKVDNESIFRKVLKDLESAGGSGSYRLVPLVARASRRGNQHVLESERFGIPQCRHRVILFGVRCDIAPDQFELSGDEASADLLTPAGSPSTVADVLRGMPPLRSGLSRRDDDAESWRAVAVEAFRAAARAAFAEEDEALDAVSEALAIQADRLEAEADLPARSSRALAPISHDALAEWLIDPRLATLPNHESRTHMDADLARYAFAAVFTEVKARSPKAKDFPAALAPDHRNWVSGKFADRFRVQCWGSPSTTITSHIAKDGHYFIHPDPAQCRALTVREAARLQTFPDNYLFRGNRTQQYVQVGNAVPPLLACQIAKAVHSTIAKATASER